MSNQWESLSQLSQFSTWKNDQDSTSQTATAPCSLGCLAGPWHLENHLFSKVNYVHSTRPRLVPVVPLTFWNFELDLALITHPLIFHSFFGIPPVLPSPPNHHLHRSGRSPVAAPVRRKLRRRQSRWSRRCLHSAPVPRPEPTESQGFFSWFFWVVEKNMSEMGQSMIKSLTAKYV